MVRMRWLTSLVYAGNRAGNAGSPGAVDMCGRYSLIGDMRELALRFDFDAGALDHPPRYNVAPTQDVLAVIQGADRGGRSAALMRWGLIPSWARSVPVAKPLINARAETVTEKPSFRTALRQRRCLILADGFYEWQRVGSSRRPMRIVLKSGEPFAFAGLWDSWQDPKGEIVRSCAIITTAANDLLRPIHNRMPVIVTRELESLWLDVDLRDPATLAETLVPYPAAALEAYQVSNLVNRVANDGPELAAPVQPWGPSFIEGQTGPRLL